MSGKNLASALQNFRQLAAKNQRIKVKSAEQWAKVRMKVGVEKKRGKRNGLFEKKTVFFWPPLSSQLPPPCPLLSLPPR